MQIHHKPTKILTVGKSGSGKTTFVLRYIENSPEYDFVFIYDHKREFQVRLNIEPCVSADEMIDRMEKGETTILYAPDVEWAGMKEEGFQFFSEWVFEMAKVMQRRCLLVIDEVNRFTTTSDLGWEFQQTIEDGRLQGLDFIGTAHGSNSINTKLRAQLTEIVAFKTIDHRPLEFLEDCGFDPETVKKLDTGEFISKNLDTDEFSTGRLFGKGKAPEAPDDGGAVDSQDSNSIDGDSPDDTSGNVTEEKTHS